MNKHLDNVIVYSLVILVLIQLFTNLFETIPILRLFLVITCLYQITIRAFRPLRRPLIFVILLAIAVLEFTNISMAFSAIRVFEIIAFCFCIFINLKSPKEIKISDI